MRILATIGKLGVVTAVAGACCLPAWPASASQVSPMMADSGRGLAGPTVIPPQAQAIVSAAERWVTSPVTPYCWGGGNDQGPTHGDGEAAGHYSGPKGKSGCYPAAVKGFDCSGLVKYAIYQALHISLYHSAQDQAEGITDSGPNVHPTIVPVADLEPGDVVVFGTSKTTIAHDGIYVGNGQIVNAYDYKNDGDNGTNNQYWGVMKMSLSWVRGGFGFAEGVRYWSGPSAPPPSPSPTPSRSPKPKPTSGPKPKPTSTQAPRPAPSPTHRAAGSAAADDWAQQGHDPAENFDNAAETTIGASNVRRLTSAWSVRAGTGTGQPLVYRHIVYRISAQAAGNGASVLTASSLATGRVQWARSLGIGPVSTLEAAGDGEVLYETAGLSDDLVAVSAATGARLWSRADTEFTAGGSGEVLIDGPLIVSGVVNVQVLRAATGGVLWQATDGGGNGGPAAFAISHGRLIRQAWINGRLYLESLVLRTGARQWKRLAPCGRSASGANTNVAIGGQTIYLHSSCSATVKAYQLNSGARDWSVRDPGGQAEVGLATDGSSVYAIGQSRGQAVVRKYSAGRIRWQSPLRGGSGAGMTPTLANGVLYVTVAGPLSGLTATERSVAFNAATGARLWTGPVLLETGDSGFVADGHLLTGPRVFRLG